MKNDKERWNSGEENGKLKREKKKKEIVDKKNRKERKNNKIKTKMLRNKNNFKFPEDYQDQQATEESQLAQQPKCLDNKTIVQI